MRPDYKSWLSSQKKEGYLEDVSDADLSAFEAFLDEESTAAATINRLAVGKTPTDVEKSKTKIFYFMNSVARDFAETHDLLVGLRKELLSNSGANMDGYSWVLRAEHDSTYHRFRIIIPRC